MAKNAPSLYSIPKTFMWFAIVSLLLLGTLVAVVLMDHSREWKTWQKKFVQLKAEKAKAELKEAELKVDKQKLADLTAQHAAVLKEQKAQADHSKKIQKKVRSAETRLTRVRDRYQNLKQFHDSYLYFFEEYRRHGDKRSADYQKKLTEITPRLSQAKREVDEAEKSLETAQADLNQFYAKDKDLQKQIDKLLEDKNRIERRLQSFQPSLVKDVLNAPMLDFVAPTLKVQQIVLEDLYDDYHFTKVQKVDRCTTCHLGIDQKGFENAPQPFKTHPNMDVYLGSASPHPIEKFGCTACHSGNGHSVSFKDSAHMPQNEKQAEEWKKKYGWHELEKWEEKMLPLNYIQAACVKCHNQTVEVPLADKLNKGRKLAEINGCLNCHKISGFENRWKAGPDLGNVKSKLTAEWVAKWVQNPEEFKPSTTMPRVFHLSNTSSPEDKDKNNAAIVSIAAYLMENSGTVSLTQPPVPGDAARGEKLVKELGCLACHSAAGIETSKIAPELSGLGSKVKPEWVYSWLKDPKHYSKETRMPNLRLSDQEASDITSYLTSLHNEKFESAPAPKAKPEVVDELILTSLQSTLRREEALAKLSAMSAAEKMQYLGKKSISHQGCYTCHTIPGFENVKPIGADLSNEGKKDLHQFDFGFTHIEHTRYAWITQKLKDPRIFDHGKEKEYYDKLRMPQFSFSDEEIEALTTFLLSLTQEYVPLQMQRRLDLKEAEIEKGRLLVAKLNCTGCHTMDGHTATIRSILEDQGQAPPILDGEGAKVQEKWLHGFLKSPVTIRPWLTYRMPTFDLSEEELTTLIRYMGNLSKQEMSYQGLVLPETTPDKLKAGKELFDLFQCVKCHQITQDSAAMGSSFLAPDLTLTKSRLKPDWVHDWLKDPEALQEGTMMPAFFPDGQSPAPEILGGDAEEQIKAIRDYLYEYQG